MKYFELLTGILIFGTILYIVCWECRFIRRLRRSEGRGDSLFSKAEKYAKIGDLKAASVCFAKALSLYRRNGAYDKAVRTWHRLGKIYHSTGYYDQAFMFYDSAYQAALLIKDSVQVALMLQCKGAVTADLNLFADSVLYYRQALTILKKAKKTKETIQITNALGLAQIGLGNHRAAAKSFDSALLMNKNQDFPELYAETLKHSSYLALKTKKYKRLLQLAQKAQKAYRLSDSSKGVLETQYLQAHGYYALKNYEKAARLCRHICSLDLPQDVFFPRAELYSLFGLIRFGQKKYDSAVKYLKTALEDETAHENYFGAMSDCYNLSLCYKKLNKPLKTKEYFDQMHAFETKLNERHAAAFVQENKKGNIFLRNSE